MQICWSSERFGSLAAAIEQNNTYLAYETTGTLGAYGSYQDRLWAFSRAGSNSRGQYWSRDGSEPGIILLDYFSGVTSWGKDYEVNFATGSDLGGPGFCHIWYGPYAVHINHRLYYERW